MGCSGSIDSSSVEPQVSATVVLLVPESLALYPNRALPPSFDTHRQYVQKLNGYLSDVLENPNAFHSRVKLRRESFEGNGQSRPAVVLLVPESLVLSPSRALPPSFDTHRQYVQKLNGYLSHVLRNPKAFQSRVKVRRESFGETKGRSRRVGI
ncbi:unnamed protein product [Symbiodinium sp. CCMP2592]|nr:unnamed protein product [Symbiodinium sp. CCMP2592]